MERAFFASDATFDGLFFTGVRTTGIFCRPSGRACKPLPVNIEFLPRCTTRCSPGIARAAAAIRWCPPRSPRRGLAPLLEAIEEEPNRRLRDSDLRALGVDPARARRYFLEHYGMTFHAYWRGRRLSGAFRQLRDGEPLDNVALGTGWGLAQRVPRGVRAHVRHTARAERSGVVRDDDGDRRAARPGDRRRHRRRAVPAEFTDRRMLEAQTRRLGTLLRQPLVPDGLALR